MVCEQCTRELSEQSTFEWSTICQESRRSDERANFRSEFLNNCVGRLWAIRVYELDTQPDAIRTTGRICNLFSENEKIENRRESNLISDVMRVARINFSYRFVVWVLSAFVSMDQPGIAQVYCSAFGACERETPCILISPIACQQQRQWFRFHSFWVALMQWDRLWDRLYIINEIRW